MAKSTLVGKKGVAEVVEIYAAVTNTELNEGRGNDIDETYHPNREQAAVATIGIGVMGSKGTVESRLVVRFEDGTMLLLNDGSGTLSARSVPRVRFSKPKADQVAKARIEMARHSGTRKLSKEKRAALGIEG